MAAKDNGARMSRHGTLESAHQHVVGFTCEGCAAALTVDSPTYEEILANGCVVCGSPAEATAFSPRKSA